MTEYWPSSVLRFYGLRRSQGRKTPKKGRDQSSVHPAILTEQAWSIKDLLSRGAFSCGTNAGHPNQASNVHLARSGSYNQNIADKDSLHSITVAENIRGNLW